MKNKFPWHFKLSETELKEFWKSATLSVDANVLLDLYRYNEQTRSSILNSIKQFHERVWLSDQVSQEFIKNKSTVIVSTDNSFTTAIKQIEKLNASWNSIKAELHSQRIIPKDKINKWEEDHGNIVKSFIEEIQRIEISRVSHLMKDDIINEIIAIFEGRIGNEYPETEFDKIITESKKRIADKTPPGYEDSGKDGISPHGDYLLWRQVMDYSMTNRKDVILVTSEQKEDWWERISNKTIGPRQELLKEFFITTKQRIIIYHTEQFIKMAAQMSGESVVQEVVEEIKEVRSIRTADINTVELIEHQILSQKDNQIIGCATVRLNRQISNFTFKINIELPQSDIKFIKLLILKAPEKMPGYLLKSGVDMQMGFHVHFKIGNPYDVFPVGEYEIEYCVTIERSKENSTSAQQGGADGARDV